MILRHGEGVIGEDTEPFQIFVGFDVCVERHSIKAKPDFVYQFLLLSFVLYVVEYVVGVPKVCSHLWK